MSSKDNRDEYLLDDVSISLKVANTIFDAYIRTESGVFADILPIAIGYALSKSMELVEKKEKIEKDREEKRERLRNLLDPDLNRQW